ncbi:MAG: YggT family protein [Anaerolineaceae bacterium]|jgi:YGGT family.|nr:MAG: YggT family protein [Anaerolineaceae bacterium]
MNFEFLALFVRIVAQVFIWIVIASALLSFFLPPFHPIRETLDRIVAPFLNPIRNIMPSTGMIDFSPLILILAVDLLSRVLISILLSF